jgi:hypothetical protein
VVVEKRSGPHALLYLPLWSLEEATDCAVLLQLEGDPVETFKMIGGCFRGWLKPDQMMEALKMKVKDAVKHNGDDVLGRTVDMRGSIVHMQVDFDPSKPILQQEGVQYDKKKAADSPISNSFRNFRVIFGSEEILKLVDSNIITAGDEALKKCLHTWASQDGFESVYGGIF